MIRQLSSLSARRAVTLVVAMIWITASAYAIDIVTLKNNSVIYGQIYQRDADGSLFMNLTDGNRRYILADEIASVSSDDTPFQFKVDAVVVNNRNIEAAKAAKVRPKIVYKSYNLMSLSYNRTRYKDATGDYDDYFGFGSGIDDNFHTNGFGVNYIHGFCFSKNSPMVLEVGTDISFNFYSHCSYSYNQNSQWRREESKKYQFQNINLQVPINFAWRFYIDNKFCITPFIGLNFRLNIMQRQRKWFEYDDQDKDDLDEMKKWVNLMSDKEEGGMGSKDFTWNVFQLGWQIGARFFYEKYFLGIQFGTDFIPVYKNITESEYKWQSDYDFKISTRNLKISVGYTF